jgi:hypothetical protein
MAVCYFPGRQSMACFTDLTFRTSPLGMVHNYVILYYRYVAFPEGYLLTSSDLLRECCWTCSNGTGWLVCFFPRDRVKEVHYGPHGLC